MLHFLLRPMVHSLLKLDFFKYIVLNFGFMDCRIPQQSALFKFLFIFL